MQETFREAVACHRQGNLERAEALYRDILARQPGFADALQMLGVIVARREDYATALELIGKAIAIAPNQAGYHYNLAKVQEASGDNAAAERSYREAIRLAPDNFSAWLNLAGVMLRLSDPEAAAKIANEALRLQPNSIAALNNLGLALSRLDTHFDQAELIFRHALKLDPALPDTYVNLARLYSTEDRNEEATRLLRKAVELAPTMAEAYNNLSSTLKFEGRLDEALACSRKALELQPDASAHSNLLFNLNYHPAIGPEEVFREHVAWAARYAAGAQPGRTAYANDPGPDRPLRIGYLSPDFRKHPVATFIKPIIAAHDRQRFTVYCYANVMKHDDTTRWFADHTDHWRDIYGLPDARVDDLIRADRIDILVELAGHTSGNRLQLMARRPAPVQASYLGYLGTTGLSGIDYKLTDAVTDPPGLTEAYHTERLVRLPHGMWCYSPPGDAPPVTATPAVGKGRVTFASFNNSAKVTREVVAVWARILHAVPTARLLMMTKGGGSVHDFYHEEFARHGIPPARLDLRARIPFQEYLALHGEVDIALDPFPYTGGTTTCHCLWMGVPVLTLPGQRAFSRSSAGILATLGLTDWVADSEDGYVAIAAAKAADVAGLQALRADLRRRMQDSPLTDAGVFTRGLEACYKDMWRAWCATQRPEPQGTKP
jgi:predicted O-linked N-acetylglucosamine transferase (SPINDLY family)